VSLMKANGATDGMAAAAAASAKDRAKDVAVQAIPVAKSAGTTAVQGVRQGVQGAKEWAAPRIEDAAEAVTTTVAPKVSSALMETARQVRPDGPKKTGMRRLLDWRWLLGAGAVIAAAGAGAAVTMRRRYASATAEAKNATESPDDDGMTQADGTAGDAAARSDVNGRVTTPGT